MSPACPHAVDNESTMTSQDRLELCVAMASSYKDYPQILEILLKRGASIEAQDGTGSTAFTWVAQGGNPNSLQLLFHAGAIPHNRDRSDVSCALPRQCSASYLDG